MKDYGKVYTALWASETFRSMSEDGRHLTLYLLTSGHTNMIGLSRLPDGYICEDIQWGFERVSKGFQNTSAKGFATRFEPQKWVWIHKFLEWNPIENPNQAKSALKLLESVPDDIPARPDVARALADCCKRFEDKLPKPFRNRLETLSKPVTVTVTVTGTVNTTSLRDVEVTSESGEPQPESEPSKLELVGSPDPPIPNCPHQEIIALYHEVLPELDRVIVKRWNGQRAKKLLTRWREDKQHQSLDFWRWFFLQARKNPHYLGENDRGWKADLSFLLTLKNFNKILERAVNGQRK